MSNSGGLITLDELPAAVVSDSSGVNAPLKDIAGNNLVNIPAWQTATAYPQGFVIQQGGIAYMATATFTSGASFGADGSNWAPLSSAELAYAQITANWTTTSNVLSTVTGLSFSVTTNGRPFKLVLDGLVQVSNAGNYASIQIQNTTNSTLSGRIIGLGAANEVWSLHHEWRQNLAAGTYNFQVQAASGTNAQTITISTATGASTVFFQAIGL